MSEMVEKVARAIYDKPTSFDGDTVATHLCQSMMIDASSRNKNEMLDIVRSVCRDAARAAIEAMADPSDEMLMAGGEAILNADEDWKSNACYRAMIDAALREEGR